MPTEIVQPRVYVKTFASLMVLLALTVGANFLDLGPFGVVVSLGIALAKAVLIVLFFMEVRYSHPLVWLFATAGLAWLLILLVISMLDYTTRTWSGPDWRNATNGVNHLEFTTPGPNPDPEHR